MNKLGNIISMLKEALEVDQLEQRFLKSLYGKLDHIRELVADSKFHIGQIVKLCQCVGLVQGRT